MIISTQPKLYLQKSRIPYAGVGLFTSKKIKKDERIGEYTGRIITREEYDRNPSGYGFEIPGNMIIDANKPSHGIVRYANDCRSTNSECKKNNSRFYHTGPNKDKIWLTAIDDILPGEEIYVDYGEDYWNPK